VRLRLLRAGMLPQGRGEACSRPGPRCVAANASALERIVGTRRSRRFPIHDVKQPAFFLPATRFCARVLPFRRRPRPEGRAERRQAHYFVGRARRRVAGGRRSRSCALPPRGAGSMSLAFRSTPASASPANSRYRLAQLDGRLLLTDSGVETTLISSKKAGSCRRSLDRRARRPNSIISFAELLSD
jgi:hypothetical protein